MKDPHDNKTQELPLPQPGEERSEGPPSPPSQQRTTLPASLFCPFLTT